MELSDAWRLKALKDENAKLKRLLADTFTAAYHAELNRDRDKAETGRKGLQRELRDIGTKLEGLYDAIADGLRSPGLLQRITDLAERKGSLESQLDTPPPSPIRLHPALADIYRQKVDSLHESLADHSIRDDAIGILRGLIESVTLHVDAEGWRIDLQGEILGLVSLGTQKEQTPLPDLSAEALFSARVVAGACSHRCRTVLVCRLNNGG